MVVKKKQINVHQTQELARLTGCETSYLLKYLTKYFGFAIE